MSMWAAYIAEREGSEMIEIEEGFITFRITNKECFVSDFYVKPEFRGHGIAFKLGDMVTERALEKSCTHLTSNVRLGWPGDTASLRVQLRYGFIPVDAHNGVIALQKEIQHG